MTTEPQNTSPGNNRLVKIGNITVGVAEVREEMLIAIDLRRRIAEDTGKDEEMVEVVQATTKDLLVNLVLNPSDIEKIITELSSGRVGMDELLEILTGITARSDENREERRRNAKQRPRRNSGKSGRGSRR